MATGRRALKVGAVAGAAPVAPSQFDAQQFCLDLTTAINQSIAGIYNISITMIQYPSQGEFLWYYQDLNQIFNQGTFDYISANVSPGDIPGTAQLSASGGFPNAYVQLINKIQYALSSTDLATVSAAKDQASAEAQTIIADYQMAFGQITPPMIIAAQSACGKCAVQTPLDYIISYVLGDLWSGRQEAGKPPLTYEQMAAESNLPALLPLMPPSGNTVVSDVSSYLRMLQTANTIQANQQLGSWTLAQMAANTSAPSDANGGMKTVDPNTGAVSAADQLGYRIGRPLSEIQNELNDQQRIVSVNVDVSPTLGGGMSVSVDGKASLLVGSVAKFHFGSSFDYDMQTLNGTGSVSSMTIEYQGYTLVPMAPTAWQQATNTGWYYGDPIAEAVANGTKDVTGFKFLGPAGYNLQPLANEGNFGMLTGLLVSNFPKVTINYENADFSAFQEAWKPPASGNLTLFGFLSLGSSRQGMYRTLCQPGPSNSEFTLAFSPQAVDVPQMQQTAFVIGGCIVNPGVGPSKPLPGVPS